MFLPVYMLLVPETEPAAANNPLKWPRRSNITHHVRCDRKHDAYLTASPTTSSMGQVDLQYNFHVQPIPVSHFQWSPLLDPKCIFCQHTVSKIFIHSKYPTPCSDCFLRFRHGDFHNLPPVFLDTSSKIACDIGNASSLFGWSAWFQ